MVASILLYSSKSWVVSPAAMRELEGFHIEDVRRLTGIHPQKVKGKWVYPHSADVLGRRRTFSQSCITFRSAAILFTIQSRITTI